MLKIQSIIEKCTEMIVAFVIVILLGMSIAYVIGNIPKARAEHISCSAFKTHYLAQEYYDNQKSLQDQQLPYDHAYTRLDGDNDGLACESRL